MLLCSLFLFYLLISQGYPLTRYTIRPFADFDLTNNAAEADRRKRWNRSLSSLRIAVEHAFGRLKGRFPILRSFRGHQLEPIFKTVEALLILHNILESIGDDPKLIEGFNGEEDEEVRETLREMRHSGSAGDDYTCDQFYGSGVLCRRILVEKMEG